MINPTSGISSVGPAASISGATAGGTGAPDKGIGVEFGELLQRSLDAIAKGEQVGFAGIAGSASTQEVVQAVMEAERSLQTALAVRNKVVEAYLEISRMQI